MPEADPITETIKIQIFSTKPPQHLTNLHLIPDTSKRKIKLHSATWKILFHPAKSGLLGGNYSEVVLILQGE